MAINPTDKYYRAEFAPPSIGVLGTALCRAFGVGATSFGAKGNLTHYSGYHRSRAYILNSPFSPYKNTDYSVQSAADKAGDGNWVSAFDFTPGVWGSADNRQKMIVLTTRLVNAAKARDPRLAALREVAGTLDGKTVVTYDLSRGGFKSPFDSSHLDHVHGSLYRGMAADDHNGILAVMLGQGQPRREDKLMKIAIIKGSYRVGDGVWSRKIIDWPEHNALIADGAVEKDWGADEFHGMGWVGRCDADALVASAGKPVSDEQIAQLAAQLSHETNTAAIEQALTNVLSRSKVTSQLTVDTPKPDA